MHFAWTHLPHAVHNTKLDITLVTPKLDITLGITKSQTKTNLRKKLKKYYTLGQRFSNHVLQPKCKLPRLYEWVADTSRALNILITFNL